MRSDQATSRALRSRDLSASAEEYLKVISSRQRAEAPVSTCELARSLGRAESSVSDMLRRLARRGLLVREGRRGVTLSAAGRAVASRTLRARRVLECYLVTMLGYRPERVHVQAERLAHAASDELVTKMAVLLGDALVDRET